MLSRLFLLELKILVENIGWYLLRKWSSVT